MIILTLWLPQVITDRIPGLIPAIPRKHPTLYFNLPTPETERETERERASERASEKPKTVVSGALPADEPAVPARERWRRRS